jgi:ubiquitin C-terminal hydrolase
MNSCVQILAHIPELGAYQPLIEKYGKQTIDTQMVQKWNELYTELHSSPIRIINPMPFAKMVHAVALKKHRELFTGWIQNDVHEFILFLIDCMHQSICRPTHMKILGTSENTKDELALKCYRMLKNIYKTEYSEIMATFYGISITTIYDTTCTTIHSEIPEPFFILDLPIPLHKQTVNITDCFDMYCEQKWIGGENAWYNEKTGKYEDIYHKIMFWNLPNVLVVSLNRYTNRPDNQKLTTLIQFPIDHLSLEKYVDGYSPNKYNYELFGICNHMGNMQGGHYTAFVKSVSGRWFHYNDSVIEEIHDTWRMITPMAYCLFYRKKNGVL